MKRLKPYIALIIVSAIMVAGVVYAATRGSAAPSEKVKLANGKVAKVTPTSKMQVRTAESAPTLNAATYRLKVEGRVAKTVSLSLDELKKMPARERLVKLPCVEGWSEMEVWAGPRLSDVLARAGVKSGADNVVFSSPGGYTTSLTLDDIRQVDPLLAYEVNGVPLPNDQGFPVRLVVPYRLGYKWIKWVTDIKVIKGSYLGYWESRGYDNKADATNR
jgi:DMSO/TMAO reductase YedYZ molybdopterin-dependent catalytic subunit